MKRTSNRMLLGLLLMGLTCLCRPGYAQDPAKPQMKSDIAGFLTRFVEAVNRGNTTTLMTMISTKLGASAIANGHILRGSQAISQSLDKLVGNQGKHYLALGTMDISNVNGLGLVTGPYVLKLKGENGVVETKGAVTFLLENQKGYGWVVTHIHRSSMRNIVPEKKTEAASK